MVEPRKQMRGDGMDQQRILAAEDWTNHDAEFTDDERAVLALTDAVTHIDGYASVPDDLWNAAVEHFGEDGTHNLLVSICAINTFNRVSIATRTDPEQVKGPTEFDLDW
ncbi:carboxymuconolactone decarboxylase family protein [Corynebacterium mucifaciens]|uniref:Alkylhydroperoxidase family enzyme n=1 Tax=Corynebacterium mucifaciens TaxID=57171 RepID=A0A7X6REQ6_9CORY|nr:carboxymuconolactone decarboxylase family protein [Corynebacterium mucifaciens]NKY68474.1 carboxymuconolactone decarboxylase family protein [Corynebacterium mucifaciens]